MKNTWSTFLSAYRQYNTFKAGSKAYRTVRYLVVSAAVAYVLLLSFPQVLFAHQMSYRNLTVYSREPFDKNIYAVLDRVESQVTASELNSQHVRPKIFLTGSYSFYKSISLFIGGNSFGKGFPLLPTSNIFINRSDVSQDLVLRRAAENDRRSLSGVIAHEVTHLLIRKKVGYWRNIRMPVWKKEGYAEYVAGGSTLPYETGVKMWKANPKDGTGYQYFKYYMLVRHLLEKDKLSVDELFNREIDVQVLEERVLNSL